ncbi:hypothetical protein LTR62_000162 [Meristemomyces frigidus]|uniref:BZIP domain-containing protein n=1 Tax=Meristemomyces frigidus TaxID=1508187 RepID=A0AAN7TR18_9PEZI|nr:hypothetical protein LTR62_000162 [Meristemomyces frigidus]
MSFPTVSSSHSAANSQTGIEHLQTSSSDAAFDPNPGYDFADMADGELRNMQRTIASLDFFDQNGNPYFDSNGASGLENSSSFSDFPVGSGAFGSGMTPSIDPTNMFADHNSQPSLYMPTDANASRPSSYQSSIANGRNDSVMEKYGQVTPPDGTKADFSSQRSQSSSQLASTKGSKLNKSERARNAANQRHSKARIEREARVAKIKDGSEEPSENSGAEGGGGKRDKYREKNRLAAAKCRAKKKESVGGLEVQNREMGRINRQLKEEERRLRDELSMLRTDALQHAPGASGCICGDLHQYNRNKASQVAYGLSGPMISSPSEEMMSNDGSSSGYRTTSRTNSMPGGPLDTRGLPFDYQGPPQSFSSQSGIDQQQFAHFINSNGGHSVYQ